MGLTLFFNIFVFIFGLAVGSFLNSVIYRLQTGESFLRGRSHCPYCKHQLSWQDLIPVLSFLVLKGRCRYCRQKISWQYPLVEIITGILFVLIWQNQLTGGFWGILNSGYLLVISSLLIIIFVYDLKHYIIPDSVIYSAIILAFFYRLLEILKAGNLNHFFSPIFSAFLASVFFLAIFLISRGRWLGFGDVKLAFLMGLFLGFPNILAALFFAFVSGAIIGTGLIFSGKKTLKSEVPFGPFLIAGTFVVLFFGKEIINWYLNFLI